MKVRNYKLYFCGAILQGAAFLTPFILFSCSSNMKKNIANRSGESSSISTIDGENGGTVSKGDFEATLPAGVTSSKVEINIRAITTEMQKPDGLTLLPSAYQVTITDPNGARVKELEKPISVTLTVPISNPIPNKSDFYVVVYDSLSTTLKNILRPADVAFASGFAAITFSVSDNFNGIYQIALSLGSGQVPTSVWKAEAKVTGLFLSRLTSRSVVASWVPPGSSLAFTGYRIFLGKESSVKNTSTSDEALCLSQASDYPSSSASVHFSKLSSGTSYHLTLCTKKGTGADLIYSNPTSLTFSTLTDSTATPTPTPSTDAPNPTSPLATVNGSDQITVSWVSGGSLSNSYKVAYLTGGTAPTDCSSGTATTATSLVITGLAPSTQYSFRICALNSSGVVGSLGGVTTSATTNAISLVSSWSFVDGNHASNGINKYSSQAAETPQLTVYNNQLYATWIEVSSSNGKKQVRVAIYDGSTSWSRIDGDDVFGINQDPAHDATSPQLTAFNSKLYLTWIENDSGIGKIHVAAYSGSSWLLVSTSNGLNQSSSYNATRPQLTVFNSKLYATWTEDTGLSDFKIRVKVYGGNDASPSWSFVDGGSAVGLNKSGAAPALQSELTVFNSKLYATWSESYSGDEQIRVAVYNGNDSSPSWAFVDGNGATGINFEPLATALSPQLTVFNSKLYIIWEELLSPIGYRIRVSVFNGNDTTPTWTSLDDTDGLNKENASGAEAPQLTVFNSVLYAVWWELESVNQIRVVAYNGNDSSPGWTFVDGNGTTGINRVSSNEAFDPQMTVFNSKLYSIWTERPGGIGEIRVAVGN